MQRARSNMTAEPTPEGLRNMFPHPKISARDELLCYDYQDP